MAERDLIPALNRGGMIVASALGDDDDVPVHQINVLLKIFSPFNIIVIEFDRFVGGIDFSYDSNIGPI